MRRSVAGLAVVGSLLLGAVGADPGMRPGALADEMLTLLLEPASLDLALRIAGVGTASQADALGLALPAHPRLASGLPSAAAAALLDLHGTPPAGHLAALASLDALPEPARGALARFLAAFVAFEGSARAAFAHMDRAAFLASVGTMAPAPESAWRAWGVDPAPILAARGALLRTLPDLREGFSGPQAHAVLVVVPGVLAFDLAGTDSHYAEDFALILDIGGHDTYLNHAGGACLAPGPASALVDLAGDDRYASGASCGVNGGAVAGAGFLADLAGNDAYVAGSGGVNGGADPLGLGFLMDLGGDDRYIGLVRGVNGGGGLLEGAGFLLDLAGDDRYEGLSEGVNGGGYNALGMLIDASGHDAYDGIYDGINGGGAFWGGKGFLLDAAGNDRYLNMRYLGEPRAEPAGWIGANGGGWFHGVGVLVDASGDDAYAARAFGVNGGGNQGSGLLFDGGGLDAYLDEEGGTGADQTVVPKGALGAQIDAPS